MIIPNADRAVIDIRKLTHYALDATHGRGQHKARVFASVFGITAVNAPQLRHYLLEIVQTHDAQEGERGQHGQLYRIDSELTWNDVTETVRSTWIVRHDEAFPRLVSCFVRPKRG